MSALLSLTPIHHIPAPLSLTPIHHTPLPSVWLWSTTPRSPQSDSDPLHPAPLSLTLIHPTPLPSVWLWSTTPRSPQSDSDPPHPVLLSLTLIHHTPFSSVWLGTVANLANSLLLIGSPTMNSIKLSRICWTSRKSCISGGMVLLNSSINCNKVEHVFYIFVSDPIVWFQLFQQY